MSKNCIVCGKEINKQVVEHCSAYCIQVGRVKELETEKELNAQLFEHNRKAAIKAQEQLKETDDLVNQLMCLDRNRGCKMIDSFYKDYRKIREPDEKCPDCHGHGGTPEEPCHVCEGSGVKK